jgi:hypothetical protein
MRAQIVALQQSIDRIIADARVAPVGTAGAAADSGSNDATVAVSRERLAELRRQVAAILASLDKRQ